MKWINITDRMPPEGTKVRTYDKDGKIRDMTLTQKDGELMFMPDELRPIYDVVWWMHTSDAVTSERIAAHAVYAEELACTKEDRT